MIGRLLQTRLWPAVFALLGAGIVSVTGIPGLGSEIGFARNMFSRKSAQQQKLEQSIIERLKAQHRGAVWAGLLEPTGMAFEGPDGKFLEPLGVVDGTGRKAPDIGYFFLDDGTTIQVGWVPGFKANEIHDSKYRRRAFSDFMRLRTATISRQDAELLSDLEDIYDKHDSEVLAIVEISDGASMPFPRLVEAR